MPKETAQNTHPIQRYFFDAFNTKNTVQVHERMDATEIFAAIQAKAEYYERLFSHTLPESSLMRVNQAGGAPVEVEPELAELVVAALRYCEATDGTYDITVGPLVELWRTGKQRGSVLAAEDLREACTHVVWRKVHVDGNTIQLEDPAARIVLGGIAKGYIADAFVSMLQDCGVRHGLVELGGDLKVFGGCFDLFAARKMHGDEHMQNLTVDAEGYRNFVVGLHAPQSYTMPGNEFAYVQLRDGAVVTSGIYERGLRVPDNTFYHHILDPRTGMPAETDIASATLISDTALDGDGYTTALVVMGLDRALEFAEALPSCEAVFVANDKKIYATSGVGTRIPFTC